MDNRKKRTIRTSDITMTAMMAALVFLFTYFLKIPIPTGYIHVGDSIILLTVCLFGTKKGMIAGAIGAGLSDLIGGYVMWVGPTLVIKAVWALIMGLIMYRLMKGKKGGWIVGAIVGGAWQVAAYTLCAIPLYGLNAAGALAELGLEAIQATAGIVVCVVIYGLLIKTGALARIRNRFQ
ncbi:MAG: ECF transporter S component [Clostridiales bacterium]|nr:ECF transporter S component [Clostridiales bacterium]